MPPALTTFGSATCSCDITLNSAWRKPIKCYWEICRMPVSYDSRTTSSHLPRAYLTVRVVDSRIILIFHQQINFADVLIELSKQLLNRCVGKCENDDFEPFPGYLRVSWHDASGKRTVTLATGRTSGDGCRRERGDFGHGRTRRTRAGSVCYGRGGVRETCSRIR